MATRNKLSAAIIAATCTLALSGLAYAQDGDGDLDERVLMELVLAAMPPVITENNADLVKNLLEVPLGTPLSRSFNYNTARGAVFGRIVPSLTPECQKTGTPVGELDQGECTASNGSEGGGEAFSSLSFSKNLGLGNIRFLSRPKVVDLTPGDLKPVTMSDEDAYNMALDFLEKSFGLPVKEEVPPPPNALVLPVKKLTIGFDKGTGVEPVVVQKVVYLRRGLALPTRYKDEQTGRELTHVAAPGLARVVFDSTSNLSKKPISAVISNWQELRSASHIDPKFAKSKTQLAEEIAQDLFHDGGGHVGIIAILIGLMAEPRGGFGLLLPAVQVYLAPGGKDTEPPGPTTGAIMREYSLVDFQEPLLQR